MLRVSDLRHKDIINIMDGRRLGFIRDVDVDLNAGQVRSVVVPGEDGFFSIFSRADDMIIPWRQIKRIGVDVILVEMERAAPTRQSKRRHGRDDYDEQEYPEKREERSPDRLPSGIGSPLDYEQEMEQLLKKS